VVLAEVTKSTFLLNKFIFRHFKGFLNYHFMLVLLKSGYLIAHFLKFIVFPIWPPGFTESLSCTYLLQKLNKPIHKI